MTTIYLVEDYVHHEGGRVIAAFRDKDAAEAFSKRCMDYQNTAPPYPRDNPSDEDYAAFLRAREAWRDAHPHPPSSDADGFSVSSVELQ